MPDTDALAKIGFDEAVKELERRVASAANRQAFITVADITAARHAALFATSPNSAAYRMAIHTFAAYVDENTSLTHFDQPALDDIKALLNRSVARK